jgi:hypothetical protein
MLGHQIKRSFLGNVLPHEQIMEIIISEGKLPFNFVPFHCQLTKDIDNYSTKIYILDSKLISSIYDGELKSV